MCVYACILAAYMAMLYVCVYIRVMLCTLSALGACVDGVDSCTSLHDSLSSESN